MLKLPIPKNIKIIGSKDPFKRTVLEMFLYELDLAICRELRIDTRDVDGVHRVGLKHLAVDMHATNREDGFDERIRTQCLNGF